MEMNGQFHALATLCPQERAPSTHWIGGWVGPTVALNMVVEIKNLSPALARN